VRAKKRFFTINRCRTKRLRSC